MIKNKGEITKKNNLMKKGWIKGFFPLEMLDGLKRAQVVSPGSILILILILSPILIWLSYDPDSVKDPLIALAKFNAFMAISTLSLNFVLSARFKFLENMFHGLDRMYRVHKVVGRSSLLFILLHPLFLIISKVPDFNEIIELIVPVGGIDVSAGIIAVYFFLILMTLTVAVNIPYHWWHNSHKFLGIVLLLSGFHAISSGSDLAQYSALRFWIIFICTLGIVSWLYMLFFYKIMGPKFIVTLDRVEHLKDITEIYFSKPDRFHFQPGQFLFIRFPRFEGYKELFPFSISTEPKGKIIRLSIRRGGDYTRNKVPALQKGDEAVVMGPYGKFGEKYLRHDKDMIWIAGGIGITPFLSLAKHETISSTERRIHLIWVIKNRKDAFHDSELFIEAKRNEQFDYIHWFTSEKGRIKASDIVEIVGGKDELKSRAIFMCGPPGMMYSLSKGFKGLGIHNRNIIYEDFNMLD